MRYGVGSHGYNSPEPDRAINIILLYLWNKRNFYFLNPKNKKKKKFHLRNKIISFYSLSEQRETNVGMWSI